MATGKIVIESGEYKAVFDFHKTDEGKQAVSFDIKPEEFKGKSEEMWFVLFMVEKIQQMMKKL